MKEIDDIRYVCISDLHLGEEDSLLTNLHADRYQCNAAQPGPLLVQLFACLAELLSANRGVDKPVLILNGDVMELAFGAFNQALMAFERLIELVMSPGNELFSRIIYIPGNHDHHIWEIARETQYVEDVIKRRPAGDLPAPMHITPPFLDSAVPPYLLNQIVRHVRRAIPAEEDHFRVEVVYPNLFLAAAEGPRRAVIHHGHYVESLYQFISNLRRWFFPGHPAPETVNQLEAENFAWIDFVWSLLGRSGAAGDDVEVFFKMLHYPELMETFMEDLAGRVALSTDLAYIPGDWMEKRTLKMLFHFVAGKMTEDRCQHDDVCDAVLLEGMRKYLFGPVYRQLRSELGSVPADMSFIIGHTHKPFERDVQEKRRSPHIPIYNTGGWTVDTIQPYTAIGGSVLLLNENLSPLALRIYNETPNDAVGAIRLTQTAQASAADRRFGEQIARRLGMGAAGAAGLHPSWVSLSEIITHELRERRRYHQITYRQRNDMLSRRRRKDKT